MADSNPDLNPSDDDVKEPVEENNSEQDKPASEEEKETAEKDDEKSAEEKSGEGEDDQTEEKKPKKKKPEGEEGEEEEGEAEAEGEGEEEEGEEKKKKKKKKEETPPPPKKKPPTRAPPPTPPKFYEVDKQTWSAGAVSNRVWEVDEEEEFSDAPATEEQIDVSGSDIAKEYNIGDEVGRGFYSVVRKVTHKASGKQFCLKIVNSELAPQFSNGKSEIDILSKLNNPNIIKGEKASRYEQFILVVLEYAAGGEVTNALLKQNSYTEANAQRLARQLFEAVAHIHQNNIIHGDLAPENIFLTQGVDSDLKIGGFSNALITSGEQENQQLVGNAEYQPPEVIMNQGFTQSADLWSLGCILYFLVHGTSPFQDSNTMRMNMKIRQGKVEFGDEWNKISSSLKELISKLIVVDPKARITAAEALKQPWFTNSGANTPLPHVKANLNS